MNFGRSRSPERRPVVVVTGGSAGVGRAAVRELARHGYDVAILARANEGLEVAAKEVEQARGRALSVPPAVAEAAAVDPPAQHVQRELCPIDVWVNVEMASVFSPFWEVKLEE